MKQRACRYTPAFRTRPPTSACAVWTLTILDRALDPNATDVVLWCGAAHDGFSISNRKEMPPEATLWGVITATIHQFRKVTLGKAQQ